MIKYFVALIILIAAGGGFLYSTQTAHAPAEEPQVAENPFGEGSDTVGALDSGSYSDTDKDEPVKADKASTPGTGDAGSPSGTNSTGAGATTGSGAGTPGVISRVELAKHNTQTDCWIGYKGVVYDITNWLPRHPGSAGAIAPFCGTADEFATAFNKQHGTGRDARLQKEGVKEGSLGN